MLAWVEADGALEHDRLRAWPRRERRLYLGLGAEIGQCQGVRFAAASAAGLGRGRGSGAQRRSTGARARHGAWHAHGATAGRRPEAIKARIVEQVAMLLDASDRFDPDRLHQEAILIASKADIREELDRLASHVAQIERLIAGGGPIGRRLDFLAQELNREANTLCSKSNDVHFTNTGLHPTPIADHSPQPTRNF